MLTCQWQSLSPDLGAGVPEEVVQAGAGDAYARALEISRGEFERLLEVAAKRAGVDIPHLCAKEGYRPDGNCRACMVEIEGERVLAASCKRSPTVGRPAPIEPETKPASR